MTFEVLLSRRWWTGLAILFSAWVALGVIGIPLLIAGVAHGSGHPLENGAIAAGLGALGLPAAASAWRIGRSHPSVILDDATLTIHHPGILRRPLHLDRRQVRALYFRPSLDPPRRGQLPVSIRCAPDLSLEAGSGANMVIALAEPLPLRSLARFGLGLWNLIVIRGGAPYYGPTRRTVAYGFFARAVSDDASGAALLDAWRPEPSEPAESLWNWLGGYGEPVAR
jgi:hypothetical protein